MSEAVTIPIPDPSPEREALLRLVAEKEALVESLRVEKDEVARLMAEQIAKLKNQVEWLTRQLFGRKSEKLDPNQMWFDALTIQAVEQNPPAPAAPAVEAKVAEHTRRSRPHGRGELPAHLPREIVIVDVPEAEKTLPDGTPRPVIGHEDTETVTYTPGRIGVKVTRRMKYGSPAGGEEHGVVIAPVPERLVPRCLADETLLAHVIVSKHSDHLPLYRLETMFARSGVKIVRQTMWRWLKECGLALEPVKQAISERLFATGLVHSDDTPVDLLEDDADKPRGKRVREARLWVATASPRDGPWTVFDFTRTRATEGPQAFFRDYRGKLVCDAYTVYDRLLDGNAGLDLYGCWAHTRRYFLEAQRSSHPREGAEFVAMIWQLYEVEREIADASAEVRLAARQSRSAPALDRIRAKIAELLPRTPPKSALAKALGYADGIWDRLIKYVDDPQSGIDNNPAENAIRPVAIGRKNWLFVGDYDAGRAAANLMSIIATCKRAGVEPYAYLCDVLVRLPALKTSQVGELVPRIWSPAATAGKR